MVKMVNFTWVSPQRFKSRNNVGNEDLKEMAGGSVWREGRLSLCFCSWPSGSRALSWEVRCHNCTAKQEGQAWVLAHLLRAAELR